jgi:4-hydroxythreonine-4-phosphate dehydrogenase
MTPLAVSLGDPAGVGPELLCAAWAARREEGLPPFFAVGGGETLKAAAVRRGLDIVIARVGNPDEAAARFGDALPVLGDDDGPYTPGEPSRAGAERALASLSLAVGLAQQGAAGAVVTSPVSKAQLAEVGFRYPGQTEFVANACGVDPRDAVMLLAGPTLRTVPLTVHNALADVPRLVTQELIVRKGRIVAAAMTRDFGIAHPRIAVAALNPHAGEGGRFGNEDAAVIAPAIATLRAEGIDATGPHPADALFTPRARETYDVALCMYHDQALVPLKALDFDQGVNMTLGLPLVRTSPDHGTAFGIAGTGVADPGATIAAIKLAGECAARRAA